MPIAMLKKVSKVCNIPLNELEDWWNRYKEKAKETSKNNNPYPLLVHMLKKKIGPECVKKLNWEEMQASSYEEYHMDKLVNLIAQEVYSSIKPEHNLTAGPAATALSELASVLVILTGLLEDGGALSQAPDDIKRRCSSAITKCRELADALTAGIGRGFGLEDEKKDETPPEWKGGEDSSRKEEGEDGEGEENTPPKKMKKKIPNELLNKEMKKQKLIKKKRERIEE